MLKISLVMASFQRAHLLNLGLSSIVKYKVNFPLEIIVVNDGTIDDTETVVNSFRDRLDIKYIFSGHRNRDGTKYRNPGLPNNIAVKEASGDIVILSCPEIYHLNDCLNKIVEPLLSNNKLLTIQEFMYFDEIGEYTTNLGELNTGTVLRGQRGDEAVQMPFLMGMYRTEFISIGGYDEDLVGYAGEDNDLIDRLKLNGCEHCRVPAQIIHLYHGSSCDSQMHWDNLEQVYNVELYESRRGQIIRNVGKEWGHNEKSY